MDTNGDGVVDEFESQNQSVPSDTTNTSSTPPPEEIQMDTNGDGVVDEFESQNQSVTPPPEEIQMDTNGDGVVDAPDNQFHLTQPTQAVHHLLKKSRWIQTVMVL